MLRDAFDCYALFDKHAGDFAAADTLADFIQRANLKHLDSYIGGWAESAFETAKAGKKTYSPLVFPRAATFADLFKSAYFLPIDSKQKPAGARFISGTRGSSAPCMNCGGTRGYSERTPGVKSHYGATFYGSYGIPREEVTDVILARLGKVDYSFEAIDREDGILIIARRSDCIGDYWLALLDKGETVEALFDDETRAFIAKERQAAVDAWGTE